MVVRLCHFSKVIESISTIGFAYRHHESLPPCHSTPHCIHPASRPSLSRYNGRQPPTLPPTNHKTLCGNNSNDRVEGSALLPFSPFMEYICIPCLPCVLRNRLLSSSRPLVQPPPAAATKCTKKINIDTVGLSVSQVVWRGSGPNSRLPLPFPIDSGPLSFCQSSRPASQLTLIAFL